MFQETWFRLKQCQPSQDFVAYWALEAACIGWMAEVGRKIFGKGCGDGCMNKLGDEKWLRYNGRQC